MLGERSEGREIAGRRRLCFPRVTCVKWSMSCHNGGQEMLQPSAIPSHHKWMKVSVTQSCLNLCDPVDCSLPVSSVHGISQARILEWINIRFPRESSWPRDWTQVSCIGRRILYHLSEWRLPKGPAIQQMLSPLTGTAEELGGLVGDRIWEIFLKKVFLSQGLALDSLGTCERNEFSEPRGLHLLLQRKLNPLAWYLVFLTM